jgi:hypothetical protein
MSHEGPLNRQINRWGFWSVVIFAVTTVISLFLPLDVGDGYAASHADRVIWLEENRDVFIAGWVNQIISMFSLSAAFAAAAWVAGGNNVLSGVLGAFFVAMATMAFVIPKFIAVWTIPMLASAAATGAAGSDMANSLLPLLNVSIPFSLYTSFDYLGFWLYAVFALLIAGPLYGETLNSKIASISLGVFGVVYHLCLLMLFSGAMEPIDVGTYFIGSSLLLFFHLLAMAFVFKGVGFGQPDSQAVNP